MCVTLAGVTGAQVEQARLVVIDAMLVLRPETLRRKDAHEAAGGRCWTTSSEVADLADVKALYDALQMQREYFVPDGRLERLNIDRYLRKRPSMLSQGGGAPSGEAVGTLLATCTRSREATRIITGPARASDAPKLPRAAQAVVDARRTATAAMASRGSHLQRRTAIDHEEAELMKKLQKLREERAGLSGECSRGAGGRAT